MRKIDSSLKRIALLVLPAALALAVFVAIPSVMGAMDEQSQRISDKQDASTASYKARLSPCRAAGALDLQDGEVGIAIIPSFDVSYGVIASTTALRSYQGHPGYGDFFPPPPPPLQAGASVTALPIKDRPRHVEISTAVRIDSAFGERVTRILRTEIDGGDAELASGLDGTSYVFQYADRCALTWSPKESTRAGRIVELVDALVESSRLGSVMDVGARRAIDRLMTELDVERRQHGG